MKTPEYFVNLIDKKYEEARKKGLSRMSLEWSKWSADMNIELRRYTSDDGNPKQVLYQYAFVYWTLKSQLLELYFRGGLLSKIKINKKLKEIKEVRKILDLKVSARRISKQEILRRVLEVT